ncbi:MAG: hypothetical protein MI757_17165 [Pirellulales bacterium]|nr:hypothetical protein [Pirellulales bacterium]
MSSFFDFFDRTYIINLPDRRDRRRQVLAEVAAAAGGDVPNKVEIFPAVRPDDALDFENLGARGNVISHREAIRRADEAGCQRVLILEDDVVFRHVWRERGAEIRAELESNRWHVAYLGHLGELNDENPPFLRSGDAELIGAHCYALARPIFRPFIEFLEIIETRPAGHPDGGPMFFDGALNFFRKRERSPTLIATPSLAKQRPSRNDCHDTAWFDRTPGVRQLVQFLRRWKPIDRR